MKQFITAGKKITEAKKALIMIHGRGASAEDIIAIARHLNVEDYAIIAPQAGNHTWYPHSFLAPLAQNEPALSSALNLLTELVSDVKNAGISPDNICFLGFSQGACLTLEFVARNARRWGGVVAFTGGLIGDVIYKEHYNGDFNGTPIFIGTSDPDSHVPVTRVNDTSKLLALMNASVTEKVYPNMGHTISREEIEIANRLIFK